MNPGLAVASCLLAGLAWAGPAAAQTLQTFASARQLRGESALTVDVTYAAGRLTLEPAPSGVLYRMAMRYDDDKFTPVWDYDPDAAVLRLGLTARDRHISMGERRRGETPTLDIALTPDVPLTLSLEVGAAEADVELGGLALRRLRYQTGASKSQVRFGAPNPVTCDALTFEAGAAELRATGLGNANCRRISFKGGVGDVILDFTGDWRHSAVARVQVGIGSLRLRLPRDLGVAITLNRLLTSFDHDGFVKRDQVYYSDNYASALHHLDLAVDASFGGITVDWVDHPE
jgi:hypothetical protein